MSPEAGFLLQDQVLPRLISAIPNAVPYIAPEDAQEVIQDGTAMAAKIMHNAEQAGKQVVRSPNGRRHTITAGNVAYYTIVKLRNGRRSTGSSVSDVYGVGTHINGKARLTSLDEVAASDEENGGEIFEFHDVLGSNEEDPATKACRHLDWQEFMAGLSDRDQAIIECIIEGNPLASLARKKGFNSSTLISRKKHLAKAILEFMGLQILTDIQRRPGWKDSINCTHERMACREERRHL
jgi:hypothetical protein